MNAGEPFKVMMLVCYFRVSLEEFVGFSSSSIAVPKKRLKYTGPLRICKMSQV